MSPALTTVRPMVLMRVCPWCRRTEPWRRGCRCLPDPSGRPLVRSISGVDVAVAVHSYDEVIRRFVLAAKNGGRRDLLSRFGHQLAAALSGDSAPYQMDVNRRATVVWVPASRDRRRRRGYDQGRLLARSVGHALGLNVKPLLARSGDGAQEGLAREERLSGPELRCRVRRSPTHLVLVDDVITTGSSMAAAARILRRAGARSIVGIAVASSQ